ncbi:hypothetical protein, partial [Lysobacter capsici]
LLTKESNSAACGRKLLILFLASKALELQALKPSKLEATSKASAAKAAGNFLLSKATKVRLDSLRSKVTKEKGVPVSNQEPASAGLTRG